MSKNRKRAEELANQLYTVVVFLDKTTEAEPIYVALNPELDGCIAQGESVEEAQNNLSEFRVDYIQHLLDHRLPIPDPDWKTVEARSESLRVEAQEPFARPQTPSGHVLDTAFT